MNVVILTTATGQGHNSAAGALRTCLTARGCSVTVTDVLNTGEKQASGAVSRLYDGMVTRAPWLFGMLYHAGEKISSSTRHNPIYYLNTLYSGSFLDKLDALRPDVVVCTHIFSGQALTHLKEKGRIRIPSVGIMTDYTCSPFWEETRLDRYVIPSPYLTEEFAGKGISRDRIVPVGIPVNERFKTKISKEEARQKLGLPQGKVVAVMGGSMGYGEIPKIVDGIRKRLPDALVVAACGNNRSLFERLSKTQGVCAIPFTKEIPALMDAVDVLVTKPGGLSSTEAAVKRVPIVFSKPIPGGEEHNAQFFKKLGMAEVAWTPEEAATLAGEIAVDPERCSRMLEAQEQYIDRDADEHIADLICGLAG